jgi:biopolymer transport protein ExbD
MIFLKKLGTYKKPIKGTVHNLSAYTVDETGNVFSNNKNTYVTKYGKAVRESQGKDDTVTLRDDQGVKVSISRAKLKRAYLQDKSLNF